MNDFRTGLVSFAAIVISLTVHEFAHAFVADRLGDPTPSELGRVSLNPLVIMRAHPFGALIMPLLGAFTGFLFGWASTPVSLARVDRKWTLRTANFLITVAGPLSNLLLAFVSAFALVALSRLGGSNQALMALADLSRILVVANLFLCFFNFIPVPPLDGFSVLQSVAPRACAAYFALVSQYQLMAMLVVFYLGGRLLSPLVSMVSGWFVQLALMVVG